MTIDPRDRSHHRRSIRLADYDYSQAGAYFLTICTYDRQPMFGNVAHGEMRLNAYGEIARDEWLRSAEIRKEIELDLFVVTPNHLHGIVVILDGGKRVTARPAQSARQHGPSPRSTASLAGGFKAAATKRIRALSGGDVAVWQCNCHERVIRNEHDLDLIRAYVAANPARWAEDRYYQQGGG